MFIATGALIAGCVLAVPASAAPGAICSGEHLGDKRFGPDILPDFHQFPVGPFLVGWRRFGGKAAHVFESEYWNGTRQRGGWIYPPKDGFKLQSDGQPIKIKTTLAKEADLDRFGSEWGKFLAPTGAAYKQRALPPQNLNTADPDFPCDYHTYRVTKSFVVYKGPIAPWFEQSGAGQQILLDPTLLGKPASILVNVKWLLANGYLVATNGPDAGPRKVPRPRMPTEPKATPTTRKELRGALVAAGVPEDYYWMEGVFEPETITPEHWFLRQGGGGWEVGVYERATYQVVATFSSESAACQRLYSELTSR